MNYHLKDQHDDWMQGRRTTYIRCNERLDLPEDVNGNLFAWTDIIDGEGYYFDADGALIGNIHDNPAPPATVKADKT